MSQKTHYKGFDVYTIMADDEISQASFVPDKGGVGSSIVLPFQNKGREILFLHDHFWEKGNPHLPGGWPFIFPVCARLERGGILGNYLYDGKLYNMKIHGFAPYMQWHVAEYFHDGITLALRDTPETFAQYPFNFLIELKYQISKGVLTCAQRYANMGDKPMPYYAGFHPYFLTPKPHHGKEKVMLDYKPKRRFCYNEKLADLVGEQPLFDLPVSIADPNINEQLVELSEDKKTSLAFPDGFKINMEVIGLEDPDLFNYVQLYTQETQPFICIEPWMGFPNAMNTVSGVKWLMPGKSANAFLKLWV
jgi:galactose mutarotase-like enzyme